LGQYALVLWVALSLNFVLPHLAPGDSANYFAGDANSLSAAARERIRAEYRLDGSLVEQYGRFWGGWRVATWARRCATAGR
jgi:peptide/nickel transport system permease protein